LQASLSATCSRIAAPDEPAGNWETGKQDQGPKAACTVKGHGETPGRKFSVIGKIAGKLEESAAAARDCGGKAMHPSCGEGVLSLLGRWQRATQRTV